jgi:tRNA (guanine10-N2)-dimethyltransferase
MPPPRRLLLLLKGDHPTLPKAEAEAVMEAENFSYKTKPGAPQVFRCLAPREAAFRVAERAYYLRACIEELFVSPDEPSRILSSLGEMEYDLAAGSRFWVRLRRVRGSSRDVDVDSLRSEMISMIKTQTGAIPDLSRPHVVYLGVFSGGSFYFGRVLAWGRRGLEERRAKNRPFFHPSTLQPKLAGCMVNLTRVRPGEVLLDPFCGAGAILVEASILGCVPLGLDISPRMVEGAILNLEYFCGSPYHLSVGDARRLPYRDVGAIATDPPYGRAASTSGVELGSLYRDFLEEAYSILKPGGYLGIAGPATLGVSYMGLEAGFIQVESHLMRVHGSLTREIAVFRRP